jgi:hypothetical protein
LREIDLTTDTVTSRPVPVLGGKGYIGQSVRIFRGTDRSRLLMIPPNMKWSKPFVYDAYADSFPALRYIDHYQSGSMGAVSRDGSLVAMELGSQSSDVEVCDGALHPLHTLHNITGGLTFDPVCDVLYVADTDRNAVVALDTNTWDELFAVDVGEDVTDSSPLGNGVMATDEAGTRLFISTASGVRMLAIPEPATLVLLGMATVALLAWARRLRRPAA